MGKRVGAKAVSVIILALDPGRATGWAVLVYNRPHAKLIASGTIQPTYRKRDTGLNASYLVRDLTAAALAPIVHEYEPSEVAYEAMLGGMGAQDWSRLGGYLAAEALHDAINDRRRKQDSEGRPIPWGMYTPCQVTNTLFGVGQGATKAKTRAAVERLLQLHRRDLEPNPCGHRSDAVAVALCHLAKAHGYRQEPMPRVQRVATSTLDRIEAKRLEAIGRGVV